MSDEEWTIYSDNDSIGKMISTYFQQIFTSEIDGNTMDWNSILGDFPTRVSSHIFEEMAQDYTAEEVKIAVFQLNPSKALGKDDFSALFFQKCWGGYKSSSDQ